MDSLTDEQADEVERRRANPKKRFVTLSEVRARFDHRKA
jgi:hypothetical protein